MISVDFLMTGAVSADAGPLSGKRVQPESNAGAESVNPRWSRSSSNSCSFDLRGIGSGRRGSLRHAGRGLGPANRSFL